MSDKTFAEFSETLTLEIPNISDQLIEFSEARKSNKGLVIELAAIHAGLTENFNHYGAKELEQSLRSWVSPYPKPIILNHDIKVDPVGRVMAAKMDAEKDGTPFVRLQVAVTDTSAVEKITDQRYLTGSVGGKSEAALCSVCSSDWAQASMFGPAPCKHVRGRTYKGQLAYLERINLEFKEYSFVNAPADSRSQVLTPEEDGVLETAEGEGWITAAKFFGINMDKEEVLEYTESVSRDVLTNMRKKESSPLYLSLKGAFLSSLAEAAMHDDKETSAVSETVEVQEDEDVLAVTEQLSDDLASTEADEDVEEQEDTSEEVTAEDLEEDAEDADESTDDGVSDETIDESEETTENDSSDEVEEESETDEEVEEASPPAQEKAHEADIDSQFNKPSKDFPRPKADGDKTRETDESEENVEETDVDATEEELEDSASEADEQPTEEATKTREEQLLEENARLKKALHRMLAERVVEIKVTKGLVSAEERSEVLEDHLTRSASSLADSIRDLNQLPVQVGSVQARDIPEMDQESAVITDDGSESTEGVEESQEIEKDPREIFEDVLVETLLGRRKL